MAKTVADCSNQEIMALVLSLLDGAVRPIPTEEAIFKAFELCPERFSLTTKLQHVCPHCEETMEFGIPAQDVCRYALKDAKKTGLVQGTGSRRSKKKDGWKLTPEGISFSKANKRLLNGQDHKRLSSDTLFIIKNIRAHRLFKIYKNRHMRSKHFQLFADMLEAGNDTPRDIIVRKYEALRLVIIGSDDKQLLRFMKACDKKFEERLYPEERVDGHS